MKIDKNTLCRGKFEVHVSEVILRLWCPYDEHHTPLKDWLTASCYSRSFYGQVKDRAMTSLFMDDIIPNCTARNYLERLCWTLSISTRISFFFFFFFALIISFFYSI